MHQENNPAPDFRNTEFGIGCLRLMIAASEKQVAWPAATEVIETKFAELEQARNDRRRERRDAHWETL